METQTTTRLDQQNTKLRTPFGWAGIKLSAIVPKESVKTIMGKLNRKFGSIMREADQGTSLVIDLPLTPMSFDQATGNVIAVGMLPPQLFVDGNHQNPLRPGCRLAASLAEFGGKPPQPIRLNSGDSERSARIICGPQGEVLHPIRLTPREEQTPCGEIALFSMRPGEKLCTVTVWGNAMTETTAIHEISFSRNGNIVTMTAKLIGRTSPYQQNWREMQESNFGRAVMASVAKFHCTGGCVSDERLGCTGSHYFVRNGREQARTFIDVPKKQTFFSPRYGRNSGQCRNCPRTHGQHDPKTHACPGK